MAKESSNKRVSTESLGKLKNIYIYILRFIKPNLMIDTQRVVQAPLAKAVELNLKYAHLGSP
jgi:hypothetical protein